MEPGATKKGRRGQKRKNEFLNASSAEKQAGPAVKKPTIQVRPDVHVGKYVKKEFERSGFCVGKIVYYERGLYRVDYDDENCEDLESGELRRLIIRDRDFKGRLLIKKKKLDDLLLKKLHSIDTNVVVVDKMVEVSSTTVKSCDNDVLTFENVCGQIASDEDSSSDPCDNAQVTDSSLELEPLLVPPPHLPPSSGNIGVPEEYVLQLFSVYIFLRSFSIRLFLSPFSLDDFVGSLNSCIANTLLDAIHVALLRALMHHLETLSSDGSRQASKCLRYIDWSLLDLLTWPVYLVHYLIVMGHSNNPEWKGFCRDLLDVDYHTFSAGKKLKILQILCDDALEFTELRAEIDMREELVVGTDSDVFATSILESGPTRVHPRHSKTSACKDQGDVEVIETHDIKVTHNLNSCVSKGNTNDGDNDIDSNSDECRICGMDGTLLCCDGCPSAYHSRCIGVNKMLIPEGSWFCPECTISKIEPIGTTGTSLRGEEIFGIDQYGQLFLGVCSHLLVLKVSLDADPCPRYYSKIEVPKVLQSLNSSVHYTTLYSGLCKTILQYWKIPENVFSLPKRVENSVNVSDEKIDAVCSTLSLYSSSMESQNKLDKCLYMGATFKSHSYVNQYSHGEFAASAAANLAIILSEEKQVSEAHALADHKKTLSANILLQVKAFSSIAIRFFWPNSEKKLVEVPRERCGWCLACKSPLSYKKACILNSAALNAIRSATKVLAELRSVKNGKGDLPKIATYILYIEESLRGLTMGPFLSASYRRNWHKQVDQASSFDELKSLLLELERNIRTIALSPDWAKHGENWEVESALALNGPSSLGITHKRGRRRKKQLATNEAVGVSSLDKSNDFCWWRGGKLLKFILQKAILPCSVVRQAARIGGKRSIPGVDYAEGFATPRRSRQYIWRAAVELSNNASQLALQVRYLDLYVKWSDIRPSEQNLNEGKGKGTETEAFAFRNAHVCDKKVAENIVLYAIAFGNQKHLPSRVMKNIIEVEKDQDGKEKYWFYEIHIPLYLIKEYEVNAKEVFLPSSFNKALTTLSKQQRQQLKDSRRDAFTYLVCKRDNCDMCACASCQQNVNLRDAVKCMACQGYCHKNCAISSRVHANAEFKFLITCNKCHGVNIESKITSQATPLSSQVRESKQALTITPGTKPKTQTRPLVNIENGSVLNRTLVTPKQIVQDRPLVTPLYASEMKNADSSDSSLVKKERNKLRSWGLIWRKKKSEEKEIDDIAINFRLKNILLRGGVVPDGVQPSCHLCHLPYNPDMIYIQCTTCNNWFHGDAVELEESKIPELMGFKCCRCRKIRTPVCPYTDPKDRKPDVIRRRTKDLKQESAEFNSPSTTMAQQPKVQVPITPTLPIKAEVITQEVRSRIPPLFRDEKLDDLYAEFDSQCANVSNNAPQKLAVNMKHEGDDVVNDDPNGDSLSQGEIPIPVETNKLMCHKLEESCPMMDCNGSTNGLVFDCEDLHYEDMEFEPQTYFSFTELIDTVEDGGDEKGKDGGEKDVDNASMDVTFKHEELSKANGIMHKENAHISKLSGKEGSCGGMCSKSGEVEWNCGNCQE